MVRGRRLVVIVAALIAALLPATAGADGHVSVVTQFDFAQFELPEGIAVDPKGNIYVSLAPLGELVRIAPDGTETTVHTFEGIDPATDFGLIGLTTDRMGNVYAGLQSLDPDLNGVWRYDRKTDTVSRLPGSEAVAVPNGVIFDTRGNLYVTDSLIGAVWVFPGGDGAAEPWIVDPLLAGNGVLQLGIPIGANGITYRGRTLYVTNTEVGSLVAVPINPDGSAGTPSVVSDDPRLFASDGVTVDSRGNLYVAVIGQSTVVRVSPDGSSVETIADADDGIDWASSPAFGKGARPRTSLYVVNFAIGPESNNPAVLEIQVGIPGQLWP